MVKVFLRDILLPINTKAMISFHSQNVPIIEDNMKIAEIVLTNNKRTGDNWDGFGFITDDATLSEIVMAVINGTVDAVKVKCQDDAHKNNKPESDTIVGFPVFTVYYDNQKLQFAMVALGFYNEDFEKSMRNFTIYANGDNSISVQ